MASVTYEHVSKHFGDVVAVKDFSLDALTNRELEVFRLIGEGLDSKEIASRLRLSMKTIGTHREKIKEKLHLKHYTELVKAAVHWIHEMKK